MKKILWFIIWASIFFLPVTFLTADDSEAEMILEKAHLFGNSPFMSIEAEMVMNKASGEKTRGIDISISRDNGKSRVFMQIVNPPFLRKMKFLQHNQKNGSTLQWIATSRGARKITSSADDERIFDSDFTASDFASISTREYEIESFDQTIRAGVPTYRLELSSLERKEDSNKKILFLDRSSFLIMEVEYYTESNLVKHYEVLTTQTINGQLFPKKSIMEDLINGNSTKLLFNKIDVPNSIPDRVFHYRNL